MSSSTESTSRLPTERPAASITRSLRYATDSGALRIRSIAPARTASTASSYERRGVSAIIIEVGDASLIARDRRDAGARRSACRCRPARPRRTGDRRARARASASVTQVTWRLRLRQQLLDAGVDALVAVEHEHLDADERCAPEVVGRYELEASERVIWIGGRGSEPGRVCRTGRSDRWSPPASPAAARRRWDARSAMPGALEPCADEIETSMGDRRRSRRAPAPSSPRSARRTSTSAGGDPALGRVARGRRSRRRSRPRRRRRRRCDRATGARAGARGHCAGGRGGRGRRRGDAGADAALGVTALGGRRAPPVATALGGVRAAPCAARLPGRRGPRLSIQAPATARPRSISEHDDDQPPRPARGDRHRHRRVGGAGARPRRLAAPFGGADAGRRHGGGRAAIARRGRAASAARAPVRGAARRAGAGGDRARRRRRGPAWRSARHGDCTRGAAAASAALRIARVVGDLVSGRDALRRRRLSRAPQPPQNRESGAFSVPQVGQRIPSQA